MNGIGDGIGGLDKFCSNAKIERAGLYCVSEIGKGERTSSGKISVVLRYVQTFTII